MLPQVEGEAGAGGGSMWQCGRPHGHRPPGPPRTVHGDGAKTKAAHARGQAGRGRENTEEGCQETAIWEQGQARTSWQQLRSAK